MFTGHVSLDYAKHEHAGWLAALAQADDQTDEQTVAPKRVA